MLELELLLTGIPGVELVPGYVTLLKLELELPPPGLPGVELVAG